VLGTPNPASSVMISRTFGAPFGGTTRGAHQGFDCSAPSWITPPNFGSGGGSCLPLIVVTALGEPSVPVTCCAAEGIAVANINASVLVNAPVPCLIMCISWCSTPADAAAMAGHGGPESQRCDNPEL
jgi:hypothetical protein